jgi:Trypsin-like peptidase domain
MSLRRQVTQVCTLIALAASSVAGALAAQQINEIQIAPVDITMTVGDRETFLATAYDERGNPIVATAMTWISTNESVVRVELDPATPNVVTVVALGAGIAQIEARAAGVRSLSVIRVVPAGGAPPVAGDQLPASVASVVTPLSVRIQPELFGTTVTCRAGGFVGQELVLTTYTAVRGSDRIRVTTSAGRTIDAQIAAYDVSRNVAVLHVPGAAGGFLTTGGDPTSGQRVWALASPECERQVATGAQIGQGGGTTLAQSLPDTYLGAPLVNQAGDVVGLAAGGAAVLRVSDLTGVLASAIGNASAGNVRTAADVAMEEKQSYGSLAFQSQVFGASARVTPLESWQWSDLQRQGRLPLTFSGPMGRYRVELLSGGEVQNTEEVTLQPGVTTTVMLAPADAVAAAAPTQPADSSQIGAAPGGGGISPALLVGGGAAVLGGVVLLVVSGGGGPPEPPPPPTTGGIRIRIPVPTGN